MSQFPNYNIIPADIIINTVTNLENLNLFMLNNVYKLEDKEYLVSTFRLRQGPSRYLALVTSKLIDQSSVPEFAFFSVNYNEAGVLSANTITLNATDTLLSNLKGNLSVVYRSDSYQMFFETPDLDNIRQVKESICALHSFPNKTFVVNGSLVLSFSFVQDFFILTYMGFINNNPELKKVDSLINYDYANGTLLVRFESQPYLMYNTKHIQALNLFPDIEFKSLKISTKSELITGGMYDYVISDEGSIIQSDFLSRIVYASTMNYTADNIEGHLVDFTPLTKKIQVSESAFIIAFTNVLDEDTTIRRYATLLVYSPSVPNFPFVTTFIPVTLTEDCEGFINFNGIKLQFIGTDSILLCSCGLKEALCKNKASIPVADMVRYEIRSNVEYYDSEENRINEISQQYLVNKNIWEVSDNRNKKGFNEFGPDFINDISAPSRRSYQGDVSVNKSYQGDVGVTKNRWATSNERGMNKKGMWSDKYYNNNNYECDDIDRPMKKNKILF
jgi:hypothetical protein